MWCGTKPVTTVVVAACVALTFASSAHAPLPRRAAMARADARHSETCKPLPPLVVDAEPAPGSTGRWMLTLRALDGERDVQVWMYTEPEDRRLVWQGRLPHDQERHIEVTYEAQAGAENVFVALEPTARGRGLARGLTIAAVPGRARLAAPQGQLLENPQTGVRVRQFTGAVGGGR